MYVHVCGCACAHTCACVRSYVVFFCPNRRTIVTGPCGGLTFGADNPLVTLCVLWVCCNVLLLFASELGSGVGVRRQPTEVARICRHFVLWCCVAMATVNVVTFKCVRSVYVTIDAAFFPDNNTNSRTSVTRGCVSCAQH